MRAAFCVLLIILLSCLVAGVTSAQEELDNAKSKLQLNAWVSAPTGYFNGKDGEGYFDLQRDFGFGNYVTFSEGAIGVSNANIICCFPPARL